MGAQKHSKQGTVSFLFESPTSRAFSHGMHETRGRLTTGRGKPPWCTGCPHNDPVPIRTCVVRSLTHSHVPLLHGDPVQGLRQLVHHVAHLLILVVCKARAGKRAAR